MKFKEIKSSEQIGNLLTDYFQICKCQRKIKTIIDNLVSIRSKCNAQTYDFTGAEWLLLAMMDSNSNAVMHGINCEYPIINDSDTFWQWIDHVKDSPYLKDN